MTGASLVGIGLLLALLIALDRFPLDQLFGGLDNSALLPPAEAAAPGTARGLALSLSSPALSVGGPLTIPEPVAYVVLASLVGGWTLALVGAARLGWPIYLPVLAMSGLQLGLLAARLASPWPLVAAGVLVAGLLLAEILRHWPVRHDRPLVDTLAYLLGLGAWLVVASSFGGGSAGLAAGLMADPFLVLGLLSLFWLLLGAEAMVVALRLNRWTVGTLRGTLPARAWAMWASRLLSLVLLSSLLIGLLAAALTGNGLIFLPPALGFALFTLWSLFGLGGSFVNSHSRRWPRAGRLPLYLGWVLLAAGAMLCYTSGQGDAFHRLAERSLSAAALIAGLPLLLYALAFRRSYFGADGPHPPAPSGSPSPAARGRGRSGPPLPLRGGGRGEGAARIPLWSCLGLGVALFIGVLLVEGGSAVRLWEAASAVGQGDSLRRAGRVDEALAQYDRALRAFPDDASAHYNRGVLLLNRGDFEAGIAALARATALNPDNQAARLALGAGQALRQRYDESLASSQRALALQPRDARALVNLGYAQLRQGQSQAAVETLRQAVALDPRQPLAYSNLAAALNELQRPAEALPVAQQALALKPNWPEALNNLGQAQYLLGRFPEAATSFRGAVQQRPDFALAHGNLGITLLELNDRKGALSELARATQLQPGSAVAHYNLGVAQRARGADEAAIQSFRTAIRLQPGLVPAYVNLSSLLLRGQAPGAEDEALGALETAVRLNPALAEAQQALGTLYLQRGRFVEAEQALRVALGLNPRNVEAQYSLGNVFFDQGRLEQAAAEYRKALDLNPDHAPSRYNLGLSLLSQGQASEAVVQFGEYLRLAPEDRPGRYWLAVGYDQVGQYSAAARELLSLLADPGPELSESAIRVELGRAYIGLRDRTAAREQLETALRLPHTPEVGAEAQALLAAL